MATSADVRLPSIDGLRAFEAAARLGSFERAADELAITASAVSKRVATVEDLLGTPLLVRSAKALAPTAAGKEYLEQVRGALALLTSMPLHRRASQRVQRLRVTTPPTFARQILVPHLESYTDAHPQVELEVLLSIPFLGGSAGDADIEVQFMALLDVPPAGTVLMHDVVLPVAAPSLLARLPAMKRPADLAGAPLLRTPLEPWAPWLRAAGLDWPEPDSGPRLLDLGMTLEAAVSGQGVALARPCLARHWLASGMLKPVFALSAVPTHQYVLLCHAARDVSRESGREVSRERAGDAAIAFAQWLKALCEQVTREAHESLSGPA
jgi:LysR family glycine cleavage system transcriptional activator